MPMPNGAQRVAMALRVGARAGCDAGGGVLRHCAKRRPLLLNGGRGDVIDEASVVEALDEGWFVSF